MAQLKNKGFTLIELMIAIALAAILLGVATPYLGGFAEDARVKQAANDLAMDMTLARSSAKALNCTVYVTAKSGDFKNGWEVGYFQTSASNQLCDDSLSNRALASLLPLDKSDGEWRSLKDHESIGGGMTFSGGADLVFWYDGKASSNSTFTINPGASTVDKKCVVVTTSGKAVVKNKGSTECP